MTSGQLGEPPGLTLLPAGFPTPERKNTHDRRLDHRASSGLGRATALRLARRPVLTVYATARRIEAVADLVEAGARRVAPDGTDEASTRAAVDAVEAEHGAVGVLVNNAGYGEYGTVEEADLDRVRAQFETNVFGLARMCQLVLPGVRAAGTGRIVNVGSMGGRLVFPVGGHCHASKYAVEALTDALRFETASFGVRVTLIEPGLIRTRFDHTTGASLAGSAAPTGPYAALNAAAERQMAAAYRSKLSAPPEIVAAVIERAVTARSPRTRYVVTVGAMAGLSSTPAGCSAPASFDTYLRMQFRPERQHGAARAAGW